MARRKLFTWLAAASGYTGVGMVLGYMFSDKANNTPLWVGGLLILLAALLLGMYISSRPEISSTVSSDAGARNTDE